MKQFCHNCGKEVVVGSKFCSSCGTNLTSLSAKVEAAPSQFTPFAVNRGGDDDEEYIDKLERAPIRQDRLHVEIGKPPVMGETLGATLLQGMQSKPGAIETRAPMYQDKIQFLEDFKKEAGTLRNDKQ